MCAPHIYPSWLKWGSGATHRKRGYSQKSATTTEERALQCLQAPCMVFDGSLPVSSTATRAMHHHPVVSLFTITWAAMIFPLGGVTSSSRVLLVLATSSRAAICRRLISSLPRASRQARRSPATVFVDCYFFFTSFLMGSLDFCYSPLLHFLQTSRENTLLARLSLSRFTFSSRREIKRHGTGGSGEQSSTSVHGITAVWPFRSFVERDWDNFDGRREWHAFICRAFMKMRTAMAGRSSLEDVYFFFRRAKSKWLSMRRHPMR